MVHSKIRGYRLIVLFIIANARFCGSGATYRGRQDKHFRTKTYIHNIKPLITTIFNEPKSIFLAKGQSKYIHIIRPPNTTITNKLRTTALANGLSKTSSGLHTWDSDRCLIELINMVEGLG
jgi:hypothetical protein